MAYKLTVFITSLPVACLLTFLKTHILGTHAYPRFPGNIQKTSGFSYFAFRPSGS